MKAFVVALLMSATIFGAKAQAASACGTTPVPGQPHVCLSWTASTTAGVTYNVYRATTSGAENYATPLNSAAITGTTYNDTTDATGTTYYYTVVAVGTGGALSTPSNEVSAQVPVPPNPATAPAAAID